MAESPRTAQAADYIMRYTEEMCGYLKAIAERQGGVSEETASREILVAVAGLTTAMEGLRSTLSEVRYDLARCLPGNNQPIAITPGQRSSPAQD